MNLIGAARELKVPLEEWDEAKIESDLAQKNIFFNFNSPGAPHFGGIQKGLVQKSRKFLFAILDIRSPIDVVLTRQGDLWSKLSTQEP